MTHGGNSWGLPGSWLLRFAERHLDHSVVEMIVLPIIADLQHEYSVLPRTDMMRLLVLLRGYWSFWKAIGLKTVMSPYRKGGVMIGASMKRWPLLIVAVIILAGAATYVFSRPQLYRSETRILVMPETVFDGKLSAAEIRDGTGTQFRKMQQMLESRTFLARIIEQFQLFGFGTRPDFHIEAAIANLRRSLRLEVAAGDTIVLSFYAPDPQSARDVTKMIADSLIQANIAARKNAAVERDQFWDEQLRRVERDLAAIDEKIAQIRTSNLGGPQQQAMLREQARLQRHLDEIDRMKFNSQIAASLATDLNNVQFKILDEANLPDRPMSQAPLHILWLGLGMALIVGLPAAF